MREYKPDVYHLDIGGGGQRLGHADEEGGQHQQRGQVHRHHRLEVERLEEGGGVDDEENQDRGEVGGEHFIDDPPVHNNLQINSSTRITLNTKFSISAYYNFLTPLTVIPVLEGPAGDDVLHQHGVALHEDQLGHQADGGPLQLPDLHVHRAQLSGGSKLLITFVMLLFA